MFQLNNLKKKPVIIAIVVVLALVVILFAINSSDDSTKLVGTWVDDSSYTITFNKDGSYYNEDCLAGPQIGSWKVVSDGKLYCDWGYNSELYDFELSGRTLILNPDARWSIILKKA